MMKMLNRIKLFFQDKDEKQLSINILSAFFIKGVSLILSVFSTPMYIKYFDNNTVLGIWYTVLSILSWISICDLGLSSGLRNRLTESLAIGDKRLSRKYVSSTYVILSVVVLPVMMLCIVAVNCVDLNAVLNVSSAEISPETLRFGVSILIIGVFLSFILKIVNSVIYAIQKSSVNNFLSLVTSFLPFIFVVIYKGDNIANNFVMLAVVHTIAMIAPLLGASIYVYSTKYKDLSPSLSCFQRDVAKSMFSLGFDFFVAQLCFMILMSTNELFITKLFSSEYVVQYNAYYRLFLFVGSWISLVLTPLWSKITKDMAQHRYDKLQITKKILYLLAVCAIVCEILMVPILQIIMDLWLGNNSFSVSILTAISFALFGGMYILNSILTTFANGMGEVKSQMFFYGIGAVLKIPVVYIMSEVSEQWNVVVWFNALVLLCFNIYQIIWTERKMKKILEVQ